MTRQTSIDCYNQIKEKKLLSKIRFQVYEAIHKNAPCTSAEAMKGLLNSTNVLSQSRARFTELRDLGVIYEKSIRKCKITGRNVIEWDLTNKIPIGKLQKNYNIPKNLKVCIQFIIEKMNKDQIMFIDKQYLQKLSEN